MTLKPISPLRRRDVAASRAPARGAQTAAAVARLLPVLQAATPARYRLSDVAGALGGGVSTEDLMSAVRYCGHDVIDTADGRVVRVLPPAMVAARDREVEERVLVAGEATVRRLQRVCRGAWVRAWGLRGALARLEDAGRVVPVDASPGEWPSRWRHVDVPPDTISQ